MSFRVTVIIFTALLITTCVWAQEKTKIALLKLEAQGVSQDEAIIITDRVWRELFQTKRYDIMERERMEEIFDEWKFQQAACTGTECIVDAGELLGVEQMVAGYVQKIGQLYSISLRIVDVRTIKIISMEGADCPQCEIEQVAVNTTREAVAKLIGEEISEEVRTTADLYITSEPTGADVYLDGIQLEGTTPGIFEELSPGEHEVRLVQGNNDGSQTVYLNVGEIKRVNLILEPMTGDLKIISDPFEAEVWIDSQLKGITPIVLSDLNAGDIDILLKKDEYINLDTTLTVVARTNTRYTFVLEESPPVILEPSPPLVTGETQHETTPGIESIKDDEEPPNRTWLYIGGAAVVVAGGTAAYFLLKKEDEETQGTLSIRVPSNP